MIEVGIFLLCPGKDYADTPCNINGTNRWQKMNQALFSYKNEKQSRTVFAFSLFL